ncbi:hypothetical protein IW139_005422, partial [Coemansia sp. RSA 353]
VHSSHARLSVHRYFARLSVRGLWYAVLSARFSVRGSQCAVLSTQYAVLGKQLSVHCSCARLSVRSSRYTALSMQLLCAVLGTWPSVCSSCAWFS